SSSNVMNRRRCISLYWSTAWASSFTSGRDESYDGENCRRSTPVCPGLDCRRSTNVVCSGVRACIRVVLETCVVGREPWDGPDNPGNASRPYVAGAGCQTESIAAPRFFVD